MHTILTLVRRVLSYIQAVPSESTLHEETSCQLVTMQGNYSPLDASQGGATHISFELCVVSGDGGLRSKQVLRYQPLQWQQAVLRRGICINSGAASTCLSPHSLAEYFHKVL